MIAPAAPWRNRITTFIRQYQPGRKREHMETTRQATLDQMDAAALRARKELEQNLRVWKATDLIEWWDRWYLSAGHKRLGRTLVDLKKLLK